jgi:hypothetical protein
MRVLLIMLCIAFAGCATPPKEATGGEHSSGSENLPSYLDGPLSPEQQKELAGLEGKKIDAVISQLGVPERIESAKYYGMIFGAGEASVVFLYDRLKIRVYVMQNCTVLGVTAVHEMRPTPMNRPANNRSEQP